MDDQEKKDLLNYLDDATLGFWLEFNARHPEVKINKDKSNGPPRVITDHTGGEDASRN